MKKDFKEISECWNNYGSTKPYWSVLTNPLFIEPDEKTLKQFYGSGTSDIKYVNRILTENNLHTVENARVLDFGCGVGRMVNSLVNFKAKEIVATDISLEHLNIGKKYVSSNIVKWVHIDDFKPLTEFVSSPVDLIYSFIVLQHNRPTLIKQYIVWLLEILKPNGVALLHIPYDIIGYNPTEQSPLEMEMHCVPKEEIINLVKGNNFNILKIEETRKCGDCVKDCLYVIQNSCQFAI